MTTILASNQVKGSLLNAADYGVVADGVTDDSAAINATITAASAGDTILLPRGTVHLGTTRIDTISKLVHFKGAGVSNYDAPSSAGTYITYAGTDCAFMLNNSSSIYNMGISATGVGDYAVRVGNNTGTGAISWGGVLSNVMLVGGTVAGLHEYGNQLGYMEKVYCQSNTGAGKLVESSNNTHSVSVACRYFNNSEEGVLYGASSSFANHKYYGCHSESNGYEGVKNELASLNGFLWEGGWIESNNTDASHSSGYYNIYLNNASNARCKIDSTMFNGATTVNNTHIGFKGELTLGLNTYQGDSKSSFVEFKGVNDILINDGDALATVTDGTVLLNSQNNKYVNTNRDEVIHFDDNRLLGGGFNNVPRLSGVTITNQGAVATTTFNLPPDSRGVDIAFSTVAAQIITLQPSSGEHIIPTGTGADDPISSSGTLGDYMQIENVGSVYWQEVSKIGTWS